MKKILVCAALFAVVFLTVSCGGSGSNDEGSYRECSYGDHVCKYGDSYYCGYSGSDLIWMFSEHCDYCDSWTGKCDNSQTASSECSAGEYKCDGSYSYSCYNGYWSYDEYCSNGCNSSTGKCDDSLNLSCTSIYSCYADCADNACAQRCVDNGSETGQRQFYAMYNCWIDNCSDATSEEFSDCAYSNCSQEMETCGFTVPDGNDDPDDECAEGLFYYQGTCQSPWGKKWIVTFIDAKVAEKNADGETWDAAGGLPDLFAVVKINGTEVFRTNSGKDSTSVTWNKSTTIEFSAKTDKIFYCLYDEDVVGGDTSSDTLSSNDEIGCFEHKFQWFSLGSLTINSAIVDHFNISLEPAW